MAAKLLPCPFCGSTNITYANNCMSEHEWFCQCQCGVTTGMLCHQSKDSAAEQWNRRQKSLEGVQTQSGEAPNQQLKQAIALVRAAGDKYIKPDDYLMSYGLLLTTIEQRACV